MEHALITGGAGFIGRFGADKRLRRGNRRGGLDSLIEQVHGEPDGSKMPNPKAVLVRGDVRDTMAACGTPILSDRWDDIENLFEPGRAILLADTTADALTALDSSGLETIGAAARAVVLAAHTAAHRAAAL